MGNLSEEVDDPAAIVDIDEDSHGSTNLTQDDRFSTDSSETESVNDVFQDDDLDGIVPLLESSTFLDEEQHDENVVAQLGIFNFIHFLQLINRNAVIQAPTYKEKHCKIYDNDIRLLYEKEQLWFNDTKTSPTH